MERNLTNEESQRLEAIKRQIPIFAGLAWACIGLGIFVIVHAWWTFRHEGVSLSTFASIGSYFQGTVASLWALASFLFVYVAFLGQREELEHQRQQIKAQDESHAADLKEQREQFALQQASINRQNFEASFFKLLELQNQTVSHLRSGSLIGKEAFSGWYSTFANDFDQFIRRTQKTGNMPTEENYNDRALMTAFCAEYFNQNEYREGHYYRGLAELLRFIDGSDIKSKSLYINLLVSQLSKLELVFIFCYGLTASGDPLKKLIEKTGLFKNLQRKALIKEAHASFYEPSAFEPMRD